MFSKACQYGIQAVLYIAIYQNEKGRVGLREISKTQDIPHHFLSKILQKLVKFEILNSVKGPRGGFELLRPAEHLTLYQIVEIIDSSKMFDRCGIGLKTCSDLSPCPIHNDYKLVKDKIRKLLSEKTVAELCEDVKNKKSIVSLKS